MPLSHHAKHILDIALAEPAASKEVIAAIDGGSDPSPAAAVADLTATATSGTLPAAGGSVTIADATTPTAAELLDYCEELRSTLNAALAALRTHGIIASS